MTTSPASAAIVDAAITSRMSARAFTSQPVAKSDIEAILQLSLIHI